MPTEFNCELYFVFLLQEPHVVSWQTGGRGHLREGNGEVLLSIFGNLGGYDILVAYTAVCVDDLP